MSIFERLSKRFLKQIEKSELPVDLMGFRSDSDAGAFTDGVQYTSEREMPDWLRKEQDVGWLNSQRYDNKP